MILLDTNIISALMAPSPPSTVRDWLNDQNSQNLYLSSITIAEIGFGLQIMPDGKRREFLTRQFQGFVATGFQHRLLNFDEKAAHKYAEIMAHRRQIGRPMCVPDGQIASIARSNNFAVATRNTRDFEKCGIKILNPFDL